jgi:hypothetical protein
MLAVVAVVNRSQPWYERGRAVASVGAGGTIR